MHIASLGTSGPVYMPEASTQGWREAVTDDFTEIDVDGSAIKMSSRVLRMMIEFGVDDEQRSNRAHLMHDCFVFALSCESGDPLRGVHFGPNTNRTIHVGNLHFRRSPEEYDGIEEPRLGVGEIAYTANALPWTPDFANPNIVNAHLMVRATIAGDDPIYLSKFGPNGPVAAHRLDDSLSIYPAKIVGRASNLSITSNSL